MPDLLAAAAEGFIIKDESAEFFRYTQAFACAIEIGIYDSENGTGHRVRL